MPRFHRTVPFASLVALSAAVACGSSSKSTSSPDAGPDAQAVFEASTDAPAEAGMDASMDAEPIKDSASDAMMQPISAGSSGAFAVVPVSGKEKMYLPVQTQNDAGNSVIAVVDVGIPGNGVNGAPALIKNVDLGTTNYATTTGGTSGMIVAASTQSDDVWFIDPATDTLVSHLNLGATYGSSSFSGGGGFVTGIAADATTNHAILSVWNGFAIVDLKTQMILSVIQAPPSENFGYDSVHQRILAPFYDCMSSALSGMPPAACNTPMAPEGGVQQSGLSIIDLTDNNTVYTYEDPAAADPLNPLGGEPDSAAADATSQIYVVPSEGAAYQNILDFSKAVFDKPSLTVTAPHTILTAQPQGLYFQGVAVDPNSHLGFFADEGGHEFLIANMVQAYAGNQGFVYAYMPDLPNGGGPYGNLGDPHGVAVAASIPGADGGGGGRPLGFLVDRQLQWVARIDLEQLFTLEESDGSVLAGTTQIQPALTYLDATTAE